MLAICPEISEKTTERERVRKVRDGEFGLELDPPAREISSALYKREHFYPAS